MKSAAPVLEAAAPDAGDRTGFIRAMTLTDATMLVAGSMIGSGVFIVSADIGRTVGSPFWLLVVWTVTAIMTVLGALAYAMVGAAPAGSDLLYFAFVNYTTLGYGDITPVQAWRLSGPMTAMNGILMFGWSTAVLFEVLRKTLEHLAAIDAPGFSSADRDRRAAGGPEVRSGADWRR